MSMGMNALIGYALAFLALATNNIAHPAWLHEPVLLTDPQTKDVHVPAGEGFNITCYVESEGEEQITTMLWLQENEVVPNDGNKMVTRDGDKRLTLTISNVTLNDSGIYQCNVIYGGTQILKREIHLHAYNSNKPTFEFTLADVIVEESSDLELKCYAKGATPMFSEWYNEKPERIFNVSGSISISETTNGSKLTICSITATHSGSYMCAVQNKYGWSDLLGYRVEVKPKGVIPTFEKNHENITVEESTSLQMACFASGSPSITYEWYDQNNQSMSIVPSSVFMIELLAGSRMTVFDMTVNKSGLYVCNASNKYGAASKVYQVNVMPKALSPMFESSYEFITVEETSDLEIMCQANGTMPITYKWYDQNDQRILKMNGSVFISETRYGSVLIIRDITTNQSGFYMCIASNRYGLSKKEYQVEVTHLIIKGKRPSFEISYEKITVEESSNVELTCHADGTAPITYEWYDQNRKNILSSINTSTCVSKSSNASVLAIYNLKANHSELYICNASNEFGVASKVYEVVVINKGKRPAFEINYEKITVDESSNVEIKCHADGTAPITYEWYDRNGKGISSSINTSTCVSKSSNASVLAIYNVKANHSELYICNASNEFGVASKVYEVIGINKGEKPKFEINFENITVEESSNVQFLCYASGTPPITYEWYDQNNKTISCVNCSISTSEALNGSILTIYDVSTNLSGLYTCSAHNKYGLAKKWFSVGVTPKGDMPTFEIDYENITLEESSNLEITCHASGATPINYEWYDQNNQRILSVNGSVFITETQNGSVLTIYGLTTNQSGSYMCTARNRYGVAEKEYMVEVTPKGITPTFEINYEEITADESSNIELTCEADGTTPIKYEWYDQNENRIFSSINSSTCVSKSSNASLLAIYNVKANRSELYICNASNEFGVASKVYEVRVIPKGNDTVDEIIAFEDIKTLKIGTNNVTFDIPLQKKFQYIDVFAVDTRNRGAGRGVYRRWYPGDSYVIPRLISAVQYEFHFEIPMPNTTMLKGVITETLRPEPIEIGIFKLGNGSVGFELLLLTQDPLRKTMNKVEVTYYAIKRMASSKWIKFEDCAVTTVILGRNLFHTISGLMPNNLYEIKVRVHTDGGYGEPFFQKITA